MKEENKKMMIDFAIKESDFYQNIIKEIKDTVEGIIPIPEKLFYLELLLKQIEIKISEMEIEKIEKAETEDPNFFNIDDIALYKVIEYVNVLSAKYRKQLDLLEDLQKLRKGPRSKEKTETSDEFNGLSDTIKQKLELILSDEEREKINDLIKEKESKPIAEQKDEPILLQKKDVMKLFKVTQVTINAWMRKGLLPYTRMGRRLYYKRSDIDELLDSKAKIVKKR